MLPQELASIFVFSILSILFGLSLRIPPVVALIGTGIVIGPSGLHLVDAEGVEVVAHFGVVLLLFSIGMEFSLQKMFSMQRLFFVGGPFQLFVTLFISMCVPLWLDRPVGEAIFLGSLLSLSSTAIVLKILDENKEVETPHGRYALSVVIFQDMMTIPMLLIVPLLAGGALSWSLEELGVLWLKSVLVVVTVWGLSRYLVPMWMHVIAQTRRRDTFLLAVLSVCFCVAYFASLVGLPFSLGAFLAGLTVSESEYRHQAIGDVLPFKDLFTSFFFISVGMLLDSAFFIDHFWLIASVSLAVMLWKQSVAFVAAMTAGLCFRSALLGGVYLGQVGEFSLVLAQEGMQYDLGTRFYFQLFLSVSVVSMACTPLLIRGFKFLVDAHLHRFPRLYAPPLQDLLPLSPKKRDHVVIVGYGACGQALGKSCAEANIPFVCIDMHPDIVRHERRRGTSIVYGDASHDTILEQASLGHARLVVVVIQDRVAESRVVQTIGRLYPSLALILRTTGASHSVEPLVNENIHIVFDYIESGKAIFSCIKEHYDRKGL